MIEAEKQAQYEELMRRMNNPERFMGRNSIEVIEIGEKWAKSRMENTKATQNPLGGIHGGALSTLADVTAAASLTSLGWRARVTLHNTMSYLRPACPGPVYFEAHVRKAGKTVAVSESTIVDSEGAEVAIGTFTFYFTGGEPVFVD